MSNRRSGDGMVARHRERLPRQRKSVRLDLRLDRYTKLLKLVRVDERGRPEPLVSVVERWIDEAEIEE